MNQEITILTMEQKADIIDSFFNDVKEAASSNEFSIKNQWCEMNLDYITQLYNEFLTSRRRRLRPLLSKIALSPLRQKYKYAMPEYSDDKSSNSGIILSPMPINNK